jgi:hypothetical protein
MSDHAACLEHVDRLTAVDIGLDGAWSTYVCIRCDEERLVGPGEIHPQTV